VNLGTSCANLDPGISSRCSSPDLSPSSRTFVELTPRQLALTVGIAATGFCYSGGILQLFHRRYQQIFSTSTRSTNFATTDRSSQIDSTEFIINISYHLHRQDLRQQSASTSSYYSSPSRSFVVSNDSRQVDGINVYQNRLKFQGLSDVQLLVQSARQ
jgi:hypothetical protein